jgi:hypothetical protein
MDDRSCSLHAHLTLPKQVFADKYQLFDPLFMASKGLKTVHYKTSPVDLEAPAYTTDLWGSSVLIELAPLNSSSPFDRVNIGYDGLFGPRTIFWHLNPEAHVEGVGKERLVSGLSVPVLDLDGSSYVEAGTAWVVGLGFLWVLWCLWGVWRGSGFGAGKEGVAKEKKVQ